MPAALDVSFLGSVADASTSGDAAVELLHDACVDAGGLTLSADASAKITIGTQYAESGAFSVAFWVLPDELEVWTPEGGQGAKTRRSHPRI